MFSKSLNDSRIKSDTCIMTDTHIKAHTRIKTDICIKADTRIKIFLGTTVSKKILGTTV